MTDESSPFSSNTFNASNKKEAIKNIHSMSKRDIKQLNQNAFSIKDAAQSKAIHLAKKKKNKYKKVQHITDDISDDDENDCSINENIIYSQNRNDSSLIPESIELTEIHNSNEDGVTLKHTTAEHEHKGRMAEFIKSIVFGGLDGIITLFAMVASISGSDVSVELILVLGFAKLVADGLSMGVGDFLSESAEIDFVKSEYAREQWEFDNYPEGEIEEMVEIYQAKGIKEEDAEIILNTMAKYPKFFIDHMMMQELELEASQIDDNPVKNGAITLTSFLFFGIVPLFAYLIFAGIDFENRNDPRFLISCILTLLFLFGLGAAQGHYCNIPWWKSGFMIMLNGGTAAAAAYGISAALTASFGGESALE